MNIYIQTITDLSHQNKYLKWYIDITENAQRRATTRKEAKKLLGYCEKHHIVPESFFISNKRNSVNTFLEGNPEDKQNLIFVTAKEHFILHMILPKIIINKYHSSKIAFGLIRMINKNSKYINSRSFETARKIFSKNHIAKTEEYKKKVSANMKEYYASDEGKAFMLEKAAIQKISMIGEGNPAFGKPSGFSGKHHTEEHITSLKEKTGNKNHRTNKPAYTKKYKLSNIKGETIVIRNLNEFCKNNNIHYIKLYYAIKNGTFYDGWTGNEIVEPKAVLVNPDKVEYEVYNIKEFCQTHNLYYQCIIQVISGYKPQHKGWTGYKVNRN